MLPIIFLLKLTCNTARTSLQESLIQFKEVPDQTKRISCYIDLIYITINNATFQGRFMFFYAY